MNDSSDAWERAIAQHLAAERAAVAPDEAKAVARRRLAMTIPALGIASGLSSGSLRPSAPLAEAGGAGVPARSVPHRILTTFGTAKVKAALIFALGSAVGAVADHALRPASVVFVERRTLQPREPVAPPEVPAPAPSALAALSARDQPAVTPRDLVQANPKGHVSGTGYTASNLASTLAAERRLLDESRDALGGDRPDAAIAILDDHERHFPRGLLREEREALAVKTLAQLGRRADAVRRATRFRNEFPSSVLLASVERSVAAEP